MIQGIQSSQKTGEVFFASNISFENNDATPVARKAELSSRNIFQEKTQNLTSLERDAEVKVGSDKLTMMYADPNSTFYLAAIARIVVALITGRSIQPIKGLGASSQEVNPSNLSPSGLIEARRKII